MVRFAFQLDHSSLTHAYVQRQRVQAGDRGIVSMRDGGAGMWAVIQRWRGRMTLREI